MGVRVGSRAGEGDGRRSGMNRAFASHLLWSYGGLAAMAVGGLLANLLVARLMPPEALGIFNQIYAVFIIASQVAVGGIHHSALKHVAEHADGSERLCRLVAGSALLLGVFLGSASALVLAALAAPIGALLDSAEVGRGIFWAAPGLCLFAINKIALSLLNGLSRFPALSILQSLRVLVLLAAVGLIAWHGLPSAFFGAAFTAAEAVTFLGAVVALGRLAILTVGAETREWMRRHLGFGVRGFLGGLFLEAHLRVDVVLLGIFASDRAVGLYSLAAVVAEGLYSALHVLRTVINPVLVTKIRDGDVAGIQALVCRVQRVVYPLAAAATLCIGLLAPVVVAWLVGSDAYADAAVVLTILAVGLAVYAGFLPFDFILLQSGRPGLHTVFIALQLATNVTLNLILIPIAGIFGAAAATAISLALSSLYLILFVRRALGFLLTPAWRSRQQDGPA